MAAGRPIFRIFVSSTFSDFVAEREALRANLFPRLQELCRTHDAALIPVDLRWGVSREAAENRRTISICLGEIDLSVATSPPPNFIALIGDRLGYQPAPEVIQADELDLILAALALEPARATDCAFVRSWYRRDENAVGPEYRLLSRPSGDGVTEPDPWEIAEDRLRRILAAGGRLAGFDARRLLRYEGSVTEQEMVHRGLFAGALRADEVVCVFRTIDAPAGVEVKGPWRDARDEARERQRRLARLLDERCGPSALHYRAAWTDTGPAPDALAAMCDQLYARLSTTMLARLGELDAQDPVGAESEAHVRFAHQLASGFVGRRDALQAIRAYLAGAAGHPLVVHGASGVGKSALLACAAIEAARDSAARASAARASAGVSVLRFVGAVPGSRSTVALLASLCSDLRRQLEHPGAAEATDYPSLVAELRALLASASADRPILLVVDALDRLETDAAAGRIGWLPDPLPDHVHVLLSTTPGPALDAIDARAPAAVRLALQAMPVAEGRVLLDQWLAGARRRLQPRQHDAVLAAWTEAGGLPLFLRLAFEEARQWHSDEAPAAAAADVPAMVHRLVEHLSSSDEHGALLVQRSLACIAAGKNGLAEDELLEVLSADAEVMAEFWQRHPDSPHVDALPPLILARLHDALRPYLRYSQVDGTQTVGFLHAQFESVIADDYLQRGSRPARHEALARHFETMWRKDIVDGPPKPRLRPLAELPFQWAHAGKLIELDELLLNFAFLQGKLTAFGAPALVEDFALALSLPGRDEKATHGLATLRDTLLLSADLLRVQPEQFAAQLHARLGQSGEPLIEALLDVAIPPGNGIWLRPLRRCLPDASGPLAATIRVGGEVTAVAVSPDSTLAVSACGTMLDLWDLATRERIRRIETSSQRFGRGSRLHILADGDTVIALARYGPLAAFSLASGERLWGLGGADERFAEMSLSVDEQRLLAGNGGCLVLWDLPTRSELWRIELPPLAKDQQSAVFGRQFRAIAITADGARIVASEFDGPIRVWNVGRRRLERQLEGCPEELVEFIAGTARTRVVGFAAANYSSLDALLNRAPGIDNRRDLFSKEVDTVHVRHVVEWDTATGKLVSDRRFGGEVGYSNGLALHRPAQQLVSASNSGAIDLIDLDGSATPTSLLGHDSSACSVALFSGGTRALSASQDGTIKVWDLGRAFDRPRTLNHSGHVSTVSFGPDGAMFASASLDRSAIVWREQVGTINGVRHSPGFDVQSLHLLPDGQRAFAVGYDKRCRIIDLHSFEAEVVDSTEYAERMLGSALSADGRKAVVAYQTEDVGVDGATFTSCVRVLDLVLRQVLQRYSSDDHGSSFAGDWIAFRPGGDDVISSAETWTCVWSCSSGKERARHRTPGIRAAVLAPGGDHAWLAIDESIQALDLRTGGLVKLASAGAAIKHMAYCEAGGLVVTASREVSLWDTRHWVCLARYAGDAEMTACAIAPKGDRIVVGDAVGRVHMLEPRFRT